MDIFIVILLIINILLAVAMLIILTNQKSSGEKNAEEQDKTMFRKTVSQYLYSNLDGVNCGTCRYRDNSGYCEKCRKACEDVNWKISEEYSYLLAGDIVSKK
ncbi:MAG: hypothetical protein J5563_04775 [Clostridia bacterium]|nr:hypothetical protein [Clostridia bacterium]